MPLKAGSSDEVISANIGECMRSYRRKGKIGNIRPDNNAHARRICARIAHDKARESKGG